MSQLSLSLDSSLLVRDDQGRYLPATADQILEAARYVIDQKTPRGTLFTSPALVKDYLRTNADLLPAMQPVLDRFAGQGGDPDVLLPVLGVREEYLRTALDDAR